MWSIALFTDSRLRTVRVIRYRSFRSLRRGVGAASLAVARSASPLARRSLVLRARSPSAVARSLRGIAGT